MLKVGIAGMPNAGKSTLFNALSQSEAVVAAYPFSTIDTNKAVINTADSDFEELGDRLRAPDLKYSQIELWDIAGLVEGASKGEGLGNEFLGQMKSCDLLLHLVRIGDTTDANEAQNRIKVVNNEIALFDHRLLLKPFEKARRHMRLFPKDTDIQHQSEVFSKAYYGTRAGITIREALPEPDLELFHEIGLISLKSQLIVANIETTDRARSIAEQIGADIVMNAEDIGQLRSLTTEEQIELGYSGTETKIAIHSLVQAILKAARMKQFYTVGHLGVGQWVVPDGFNAQQCASQLHEEMQSEVGSVKVSTLANFTELGSWQAVAKEGKAKTYNAAKYIPKDKDVLLFD